MRGHRFIPCVVALLFATGCFRIDVGLVRPDPNLDLAPSGKSLTLQLAPEVVDDHSIPLGPLTTTIRQWRGSLTAGFEEAFSASHAIRREKVADLTVAILEASPEVTVEPGGKTATALIRYNARLLDAGGQILERLTGTAASKRSAATGEDLQLVLRSALETMYEDIGARFFGAAVSSSPRPSASPATP